MKKRIIVISGVLLVLIIGGILFTFNKNKEIAKDSDAISALYPLVYNQKSVNERLSEIESNDAYTFDQAYVELNPYEISPLSGIIIFKTEEEKEIKVYINDEYFTTTEKSTEHSIPIYGLYEDKVNVVKLVMDNETQEYELKTEKSNIEYPLNVITSSEKLNDDLYFLEGSMKTGLTGFDKLGNLRFYLTVQLKMDVEWLDNGHFLIGTPQGNDLDGYEATDRYTAFSEMDYLGKIYNYYTTPYSYDFEEQVLSDGTVMIGGGTSSIYYNEQLVYIFDLENNEVLSKVNLTNIIKEIDPLFDETKLGTGAGKNGFYYDEDTGELLVSFRQLNALVSFNYKTESLNWVITDSNNKYFQNEVWNSFILESDFTPLGQHSPEILGNGYYAFYNNKYDRINVPTNVSEYTDAYSEAMIFKVDNNKATLEWSSANIGLKYFTQKYGLFRVLENNNKLINFGWIPTTDYMKNDTNTFQAIEGDVDNTYGVFVELDDEDNILFKATCDEGKYRIFKHSLYNDKTSNVTSTMNIYENIINDDYKKVASKDYDLDNALYYIYYFEFTKNTFYTNYNIEDSDEIKLLFVGTNSYEFTYKDKTSSQTNRVFNLDLPNGNYNLYIIINDTIMNTNTKYYFE